MTTSYASANTYPYGQCTWWVQERMHQVSGHFVPWMGDAHSWAGLAPLYGWSVSSQPVNGPCIICLQPLVQEAGPLGHVAYVESIQNASTVVASNMNWGLTRTEQMAVRNISFKTGPGVSFISVGGTPVQTGIDLLTSTNKANTSSNGLLDFSFLTNASKQLAPLGAWLQSPTRMIKMLVGIVLLAIAVVTLIKPDDVAKLAMLAA